MTDIALADNGSESQMLLINLVLSACLIHNIGYFVKFMNNERMTIKHGRSKRQDEWTKLKLF